MTYPAIAARAAVSRTFLYDNPAARELVTAAITRADSQRRHVAADRDAQAEASWQQRTLNAEQALKAAHAALDLPNPGDLAAHVGQARHSGVAYRVRGCNGADG